MSLNLISYPQAIFKQATAPTGINAGALWWDTDDLLLYYYSGSSWIQISSASDAAGYEQMVSQLMLEILRLSAEGTLTAPDYESMFVDYFADADGQDGTIDTGNTTAFFSTDNYSNGGSTEDSTGETLGSDTSDSNTHGMEFTTNAACTLTKVTKAANDNATTATLQDSGGTPIDAQTFSGNDATFSESLSDATTYRIILSGQSTMSSKGSAGSYTYSGSHIDIIHGRYNGGESDNNVYGITGITTEIVPADRLIQTNAQALSFAPSYILIHAKDTTLAGSGALSFDVSFDGGSTWDSTGNDFDTKTAVTDGSSKNMIIKLNVEGTGSGNTASLKDYEVLLWSS